MSVRPVYQGPGRDRDARAPSRELRPPASREDPGGRVVPGDREPGRGPSPAAQKASRPSSTARASGRRPSSCFDSRASTSSVFTLIAGDQMMQDGSNYRIPKRDVISSTQVLLQTGPPQDRPIAAARGSTGPRTRQLPLQSGSGPVRRRPRLARGAGRRSRPGARDRGVGGRARPGSGVVVRIWRFGDGGVARDLLVRESSHHLLVELITTGRFKSRYCYPQMAAMTKRIREIVNRTAGGDIKYRSARVECGGCGNSCRLGSVPARRRVV